MSYWLIKAFSVVALASCMLDVRAEDGKGPILIEANSTDISIKGEVKNIISVEFGEEKRELLLFEDNGKEADEASRTFTFEIKTMTGTGAKLKLEGKDGLSFNRENRCWTISKDGGGVKNNRVISFELLLRGVDEKGNLEQRGWDENGFCYTFKEYDGLGEWKIIAHPHKSITNEKSGVYKGSLTISIVAA